MNDYSGTVEQLLPRPGIALGPYPEREETGEDGWERAASSLERWLTRWPTARPGRMQRFAEQVAREGRAIAGETDSRLLSAVAELRLQLGRDGLTEQPAARCFALIRELADRHIEMRHYDVQIMGGWVMLNGMLAEMETGEGKTLAATLPACTAALAGIPVHIITVNDYLVTRDAEKMGPLYRALGLSVGRVIDGMDLQARQAAYACDITYCTNKQIAFDYLRDRLLLHDRPGSLRLHLERLHNSTDRLQRLLLRGLCFAIVDEADSVLVDEARTPLIISRSSDNTSEQQLYEQALKIANLLERNRDFRVDEGKRDIQLTEQGRYQLAELATPLKGPWSGSRRREELVRTALSAHHLFIRDRHYLVREQRVEIIDEFTGRVMPDRSWEKGLHQMIEIKENCPVTGHKETLARLSYQHLFRRYLKLAGMTGTAREVAGELGSVYGLGVMKVPTHRPCRRRAGPIQVQSTASEKWQAVIEGLRLQRSRGRPVLVGTRTLADSEHLSRLLQAAGLEHQVLNARQDEQEARIIARAGERGRITVATNMAGRGTDIPLDPEVARLGGLHVIATERNDARRIDRQLFGRCARQGDPGSFELILSLEDLLLPVFYPPLLRRMLTIWVRMGGPLARWMGDKALRLAQRALERRHRRLRSELLRIDRQLDDRLAFSGRSE